jgi:hypothetical protein
MVTKEPKKEKSFYYKILLAVLTIGFLNIAYLLYRDMSGSISFYYFSLTEKTICIILSLIAMPIMYALIAIATLLLKKTNRNLYICSAVLSLSSLIYIHANTTYANYSYQQEKRIEAMNLELFEWEENNNAPLGYPVEVYRGGLELKGGGYAGLSHHGTSSGKHGWGALGAGMSSRGKALPERLNVTWLSYAEDTFYTIDCPVDYDKMLRLFKEGCDWKDAGGDIRHETYDTIIVGYAPGGVVVIWVYGQGTQVEIGRYQGKKTVISQEEIRSLDYPDKVLFQQKYRDDTMNDNAIVPDEVRKANKNKPIPYGLWDTYREKYSWKPTFVIQNEGEIGDFGFNGFNGEQEDFFHERAIDYKKRAIPKEVAFSWKDKEGQRYSGYIVFDEKLIFDAFKEIYHDNKEVQAELEFRTNIPNDFVTVILKVKDKEVMVNLGNKVRVFKIRE